MKNDEQNPGSPRRSRFNFSYTPAPRPEPPAPARSRHPEHDHRHEPYAESQPHLTGRKFPHTDKTGPLVFNVASLLHDYEGATREYDFEADHLTLIQEEGEKPDAATNISGHVRFVKVRRDILVQGQGEADVVLECVRCLNDFDYHVTFELEELFRPSIDIITGLKVKPETEDEESDLKIDANHLLNLGEAIRQQILVDLPIKPICGDDCPGLLKELERVNQSSTLPDEPAEEEPAADAPADPRWAALSKLLDPGDDSPKS